MMSVRYFFPVLILLSVSACGGGGASPPKTPTPPTTVNVNITNPTLTVADNTAVLPGGILNLVWSEEFDGTQLDRFTALGAVACGQSVLPQEVRKSSRLRRKPRAPGTQTTGRSTRRGSKHGSGRARYACCISHRRRGADIRNRE